MKAPPSPELRGGQVAFAVVMRDDREMSGTLDTHERKRIGPWTPLTEEQWTSVPNADHTAVFSRDEVFAALQQLVPIAEATAIADELYSAHREPGVFFFGELLTALSTLSESAAARVRAVVHDPVTDAPES
jgi:hypothetical protein